MIKFVKKNKWWLLLSFFVPLVMMAVILGTNQIYWGSSRSILAGDSYHQYVALHSLYSNILHSAGRNGFFYTFTSGLGLNLYAFAAYYMGSFFMPLTFFFNVHNMPDALYLLTLLKTGTMGLTFFVSFKQMYQKLSAWLILALACAYSTMSFLTSQIEIIMWLDVFILLPLIVWGLHSLQDKGKRRLYFVTLTILFIQNYYFGFMIALFLVLYYFARATMKKWSWHNFLDFAVTSLCAGMASLIMLLPMYLDLKANNTNAFSQSLSFFTDGSKPFDLFAKNFVGVYDTTQFGAVPMIYVGLLPLILALLFFFTHSINWKAKIAYLVLLGVLIASFYIEILDLFWQGMHSPNMFLHRYAFIFSLIILIMACETLTRLDELEVWKICFVIGLLGIGFSATLAYGNYNYLKNFNSILTGLFVLAYLILLISRRCRWLSYKLFLPIVFIFMMSEAGVNGFLQVSGLQNEWNFASRTYYNQQARLLQPLADKINKLTGDGLFRADNTNPDTANDGMKYGYNSISQFSSVRNSNSSALMKLLGFHTDDTFLNLRYPGNTLLMDSIFGVKYNINQNQPVKYDFNTISSKDNSSALTENQNALGLGFMVPGGYHDVTLSNDSDRYLSNQTKFVNALAKVKLNYFTQIYTSSEHTENKISGTTDYVTLANKTGQTGDVAVTYEITAPAQSQFYISIPNISYISNDQKNTTLTLSKVQPNGEVTPISGYSVSTDDTGTYFNLGYYEQATLLKLTLSFPGNSQVSFNPTSFWALNAQNYNAALAKIKTSTVNGVEDKNGATFTIDAKTSGDLFLTIPYDKGWSAKVDGKNAKIKKAQSGFMTISIPQGKHKVQLNFVPQGFVIGSICFISGIVLFIGYDFLSNKKYL